MRWGSKFFGLWGQILSHPSTTRQYVVAESYPGPSWFTAEETPAFQCSASTNFYAVVPKQGIACRKTKHNNKVDMGTCLHQALSWRGLVSLESPAGAIPSSALLLQLSQALIRSQSLEVCRGAVSSPKPSPSLSCSG